MNPPKWLLRLVNLLLSALKTTLATHGAKTRRMQAIVGLAWSSCYSIDSALTCWRRLCHTPLSLAISLKPGFSCWRRLPLSSCTVSRRYTSSLASFSGAVFAECSKLNSWLWKRLEQFESWFECTRGIFSLVELTHDASPLFAVFTYIQENKKLSMKTERDFSDGLS